ncbi:hypothetical protein MNV49_006301 [Pseudohyphozyma bogoriensis]|nr:hypothetical protein MNV49_006301 [Pseudohyphozyma bogoriensis]
MATQMPTRTDRVEDCPTPKRNASRMSFMAASKQLYRRRASAFIVLPVLLWHFCLHRDWTFHDASWAIIFPFCCIWLSFDFVIWKCILLSPFEGPEQNELVAGSWGRFHREDLGVVATEWMRKFGGVVHFAGFFGKEELLVTDPLAIQRILVTNCYNYVKPSEMRGRIGRFLGKGVLFVEGDLHKKQRRLMNPSWSAANVKASFPTFLTSAYALRDHLRELVETNTIDPNAFASEDKQHEYASARENENEAVLDVLKKMGLASLEVIGKCGFGYDFNVYSKDDNALADAFTTLIVFAGNKTTPAKILAAKFIQWILNVVPGAGSLPIKQVQAVRGCAEVMERECGQIYEAQKSEVLQAGAEVEGKDFLSGLIKANLSEDPTRKMSDAEVKGQLSTMLVAGEDTSANLLTWILFHLAKDHGHEIQKRLREEIVEARKKAEAEGRGELNDDEIAALPFLDAVVKEALRLEPPVAKIHRQALRRDTLPLSTPIRYIDGTTTSEVTVKKGTKVYISVKAFNCNQEIFGEDADEFRPERWSRTGEQAVGAGVAGAYSSILAVLMETFEFSERDVGGTPIERGSAIVMRPFVATEEELGNRLPLRVTFV